MPKKQELIKNPAYAAMGMGRSDYEACYHHHEEWGLIALHCHDFYEFYIHLQGAQFYSIDDQVYTTGAYTLMVIPPFHIHGLISEQPIRDYERCFLYISPAMLKACGGAQIDLEQFFSNHVRGGNYQFRMTEEEARTCKQLMKFLMDTQADVSALVRFDNQSKLLQFLSIICQVLQRSHEAIKPVVVNEAMQEILAYVNEHFTTPIKLEQLARNFGVSTSFLSHEFVKYTGRSVYDYVLYRRVLLAKEIIGSAVPLNEVAFQCGFNDYSSFLRAFSKLAGMSPSAYRKIALQNR